MSPCGAWVAVIPPRQAGACNILHAAAFGDVREVGIFRPSSPQSLTHCAWSSDAALAATASSGGTVFVFDRHAPLQTGTCRVHTAAHWRRDGKDINSIPEGGGFGTHRHGEQRQDVVQDVWRRHGVVGLFFRTPSRLCVLGGNGCLHAVDVASGRIQLLVLDRVRSGTSALFSLLTMLQPIQLFLLPAHTGRA